MSRFEADWLRLRESADHAAVNGELRRRFASLVGSPDLIRIVDLGAGTGSNLRGLSEWLENRQSWLLVDHDPALLEVAGAMHASLPPRVTVETVECDLAAADLSGLLRGCDCVTASALFDLASTSLVERIADRVVACGAFFYAVLTYDGLAAWFPEHPADAKMREAFNAHQRGDKGFGPALGPAATMALADAFTAHGYRVRTAPSPWVLDERHGELRRAVDRGWARAVAETGRVETDDVAAWLQHRNSVADGVTIIGHEDLLAVPDTS